MANHLSKKNPENAFMINTDESWEIIYWCKKFNCTRKQLETAIQAVGISPEQVKDYIRMYLS